MARRWFTEDGTGIPRWPVICSVRPPEPMELLLAQQDRNARIQERLTGFPDLTAGIKDAFSADDKPSRDVYDAERIPAHAGAEPRGRRPKCETLPSGAAKTAR